MEEFVRERIGKTIGGRWTLQSVLGVGGMAAVYLATDGQGAEAAVKILHPEISLRKELRERFVREGAVANRIQHPGVVRVLDQGADDDKTAFLVLERLHGESLGERVAREALPLPDLLDVLDQVLDVLAVAHEAGIVHRDLKPDNLFLTEDGQLKVLDFGVARVLEAAPDDMKTRTGIAMGTLPYMAPEQALGKRSEIDGRVDIFALGATAFRILAKRRIHDADSEAGMLLAMATKPAPPLRSVAEHVPENVAAIIDLALAFNRDARYPDARTMQEDVRAVQRAEAPAFASARLRARHEATRQATRVAAAPVIVPAVVAAVTPAPAPAPWNTAVPEAPTTLPRVQGAPPLPPPPVAPAPHVLPTWAVAAGALGCLLLGALLWLLWPSPESTVAAPEVPEPSEAVSTTPAQPQQQKEVEAPQRDPRQKEPGHPSERGKKKKKKDD